MNSISKKIIVVFTCILSIACEDVIQIDTPNIPPKLVIEASINWLKGTPGNFQIIKLSLSAPYFDTQILPANNAEITVTDSSNNTFVFSENEDTGIYMTYNFIPKINEEYTLNITYQNETYIGTELLKSITSITRVEQENNKGFSGDETELKAYYLDPENEENYYFFEFINDKNSLVDLEIYDDEFTNGNEIFGFFSKEDLNTGDEIIIRNYGISKRFYEFIFLLLQQKTDENGSPFETQPTSIRGNCVNITNPSNYPFGYFRLSEADQFIYTIE
ncbi:DUF4249 family protein [Confluentibacter flavum]|uniref:DUF4249 domain-containing protein n=1 Tax=Confluentibacter flavum TaxID=1909700 RepID=A0A2N3HM34_9FLAO|nr:DUF4249 family protein [Confluentibacter flavum]PKQ46001.1 DUF4249 domain-containing protein [Confluentibacter flavum]